MEKEKERERQGRKEEKEGREGRKDLVSPFARCREYTKTRLERNGGSRNLFIWFLSLFHLLTLFLLSFSSFSRHRSCPLRMLAVCKFFGSVTRARNNFMEIPAKYTHIEFCARGYARWIGKKQIGKKRVEERRGRRQRRQR